MPNTGKRTPLRGAAVGREIAQQSQPQHLSRGFSPRRPLKNLRGVSRACTSGQHGLAVVGRARGRSHRVPRARLEHYGGAVEDARAARWTSRPSWRAIARMLTRARRRSAMMTRSCSDRYRPERGSASLLSFRHGRIEWRAVPSRAGTVRPVPPPCPGPPGHPHQAAGFGVADTASDQCRVLLPQALTTRSLGFVLEAHPHRGKDALGSHGRLVKALSDPAVAGARRALTDQVAKQRPMDLDVSRFA